jgi:hypothetical protein
VARPSSRETGACSFTESLHANEAYQLIDGRRPFAATAGV